MSTYLKDILSHRLAADAIVILAMERIGLPALRFVIFFASLQKKYPDKKGYAANQNHSQPFA
jgi:hypothetical protein